MILHVDMDAFYASVEERETPSLVGKPVIVGGSAEGRGVVAAANYEARKFGVHSAMAAARARKLCPHAAFVTPRMNLYADVSRQIRGIFERFTPLVEPLSLDEAFLDVAGSQALFGPATEIGRRIKVAIREETRLVASVGVAPNKFLAKIASDLRKPDGFVVVEQEGVREFLDPLPVGRIWGVGKVTRGVFERLAVRTIGELRHLPEALLHQVFGSSGEHYLRLAHGLDDRRVVPDRNAKSISHETTFPKDIRDRDLLRTCLAELVEQVARRLRRHGRRCRTIELKIRFSNFQTVTRSATLAEATDITQELLQRGADLLTDNLPARPAPIRLLGFGVHGLEQEVVQPTLF
ncbi:MAG TPA: DNA polymerase IV, partial [Gemmataceae bacterium]|nr:DNA polymerase IV [Gemmataceae bacterium]